MKAIISGATRGIGKAIALQLREAGYDLVLMARNKKDLEDLKTELGAAETMIVAIDLSEKNALRKVDDSIFKNTTLLINNLGVYSTQKADNLNLDVLQDQLNTNVYSAIQLTQRTLPFLRSNESGSIINIASVMALEANSQAADYSISKHAFKAWNDALRESLKKENIKVSAIYPGAVNTSSWNGLGADRAAMIQAEDIAEMVHAILKMNKNTLIDEIRISPRDFQP